MPWNCSWPLTGLKSEFWFRAVHADGNFIQVLPPPQRIDFWRKVGKKFETMLNFKVQFLIFDVQVTAHHDKFV